MGRDQIVGEQRFDTLMTRLAQLSQQIGLSSMFAAQISSPVDSSM